MFHQATEGHSRGQKKGQPPADDAGAGDVPGDAAAGDPGFADQPLADPLRAEEEALGSRLN